MAMSEAKKRANKKWNDANLKSQYDRLQLVVPKGVKAIIDEYAKGRNESVNGLMNRLLMAELGATPESWKRGEVALPEPSPKRGTWEGLEVAKRLAAEELKRREEYLEREAERKDMLSAFHEDMNDSDE